MKRGAMIGLVVGAVAVVAAAGAVWWMLSRPPSAEAVAEQYLRALSQGDFDAIESVLATEADELAQVEAAFSGAVSYISDASFEIFEDAPDLRSVRADVTLAGESGVVGFVLAQQDGRWLVSADYLATLTVTTTIGDSVRVGGILVAADTPTQLLPALYPVVAAPAGLLVGETTARVTNEAPVSVAVDSQLAPEAAAAAQEQLDAYADACAAPGTSVPDSCGLRIPWAADLATLSAIAFRIDAYPQVVLAADAGTFAATGGDIVATATGTTRDGAPGTFTYRADDWALRGTLAFTGDEMVLAVR